MFSAGEPFIQSMATIVCTILLATRYSSGQGNGGARVGA
jgi:hypothetical protein